MTRLNVIEGRFLNGQATMLFHGGAVQQQITIDNGNIDTFGVRLRIENVRVEMTDTEEKYHDLLKEHASVLQRLVTTADDLYKVNRSLNTRLDYASKYQSAQNRVEELEEENKYLRQSFRVLNGCDPETHPAIDKDKLCKP